MESLRLPIMFTGAHSYSSSPVELLFSRLKATNINERNLPMGKRYVFLIYKLISIKQLLKCSESSVTEIVTGSSSNGDAVLSSLFKGSL